MNPANNGQARSGNDSLHDGFNLIRPPQATELPVNVNRKTLVVIILVCIFFLLVGGAGAIYFISSEKNKAARDPDPCPSVEHAGIESDPISEESGAPVEIETQKNPADADTESKSVNKSIITENTKGGNFIEIRAGVPIGKDLCSRFGLSYAQVQKIVDSLKGIFDFKKSAPGHLYSVKLSEENEITYFEYRVSPIEIYEVKALKNGRLKGRRKNIPLEKRVVRAGGTITSSLYTAMSEAGLAPALAAKFVDIMGTSAGYFNRQRPGDTFRIIVTDELLNGEHYRYGDVAALEYDGEKTGKIRLFRYEKSGFRLPYFDKRGVSVPRPYIKIPLRYSRVSSPFDPKRFHPVLKRRVPHMGVDFAASTGTAVWAALDGTVSFVGYKGANGRLVILNHERGARTYYAHLSRFARIKAGQKVRQGQVIGYVGSTGRSTGPHLHFGFKMNGSFRDPLKYRMLPGKKLHTKHRNDFKAVIKKYSRILDNIDIQKPEIIPDEIEGGYGIESGEDMD